MAEFAHSEQLIAVGPGTRLGPYEIVSAVGAGGMGEVYKAKDTRLDRTIAIKILPEALTRDAQFRERFHLAFGANVTGSKPQYVVGRDRRFLLNVRVDEATPSPITVVLNGLAALKK